MKNDLRTSLNFLHEFPIVPIERIGSKITKILRDYRRRVCLCLLFTIYTKVEKLVCQNKVWPFTAKWRQKLAEDK